MRIFPTFRVPRAADDAAEQTTSEPRRQLHPSQYTVGWVSALPVELAAAQALLDATHEPPASTNPIETNIYTLGQIAGHNVVLAALPYSRIGPSPAAWVTAQMKAAFPNLQFILMVGIGGGVPQSGSGVDVRLGDVVVGKPNEAHGGVVQYDSGKTTLGGFQRTGFLNSPPTVLLKAITELEAKRFQEQLPFAEHLSQLSNLKEFQRETAGPDVLFEALYDHVGGDSCAQCKKENVVRRIPRQKDVMVYYGTIASGNKVIKDARERDQLGDELGGVLCFEMEAAGLMNDSPCLVIRGICDYADSHKNKRWQPYAAGTAAAYGKTLLSVVPSLQVSDYGSASGQGAYFANRRRLECLSWLSTASYHRTQTQIRQLVVPGTGTWLFEKPEYVEWKDEPRSGQFWLHGLPGFGKTTIAERTNENTAASTMLTFLHQILSHCPSGYNLIEEQYERWASSGIDQGSILFDEIADLYRSATESKRVVYLVIDALDEIKYRERQQLLTAIKRLSKHNGTQYKVLITTRELESLDGKQWGLSIKPSDNEADIRQIVRSRTENNSRLVAISPDTRQYLRHILVQRAQGMLLWVELQLDELADAMTESEMLPLVDQFPKDLESIYQSFWTRINNQRVSKRLLAQTVLELLTFSEQTISLGSKRG
ncbi:hypothetical protein HK57_00528 [Aspergillus ustus]|uniref:Nucleoside phosphorylase domain-containing protein n=1 Tax=Aspergillus ustus TaxID=40382 RepID=A0A0C1E6F0_ASPUT|nr:hypothetical protein HK57_00528 [Aspergillus ustus]